MKHIRYLKSNLTICEHPEGLKHYTDAVVADAESRTEPSCKLCYEVLLEHNNREFQKEQLEKIYNDEPQHHAEVDWEQVYLLVAIAIAVVVGSIVLWDLAT